MANQIISLNCRFSCLGLNLDSKSTPVFLQTYEFIKLYYIAILGQTKTNLVLKIAASLMDSLWQENSC